MPSLNQPGLHIVNQPTYLAPVPSATVPTNSVSLSMPSFSQGQKNIPAAINQEMSVGTTKENTNYLSQLVGLHPAIPPAIPSMFPMSHDNKKSNMESTSRTRNVYIRGLPPNTSDENLLLYTNRFGKVSSSKAIIDMETNLCKGYGFACFEEEKSALICISAMTLCGYQCSFAKESFSARLQSLQDTESTNLYISNLPLHWNESDISTLFKPSKIISNRVLRDSKEQSRGVGFARMQDRKTAEDIINKFNNFVLDPALPPLQIRFADSTDQKKFKGQTQKRRLWRAREYSVLTKGMTANNAFSKVEEFANNSMPSKVGMYVPLESNTVYQHSPTYDTYGWQSMYPSYSVYPSNYENSRSTTPYHAHPATSAAN